MFRQWLNDGKIIANDLIGKQVEIGANSRTLIPGARSDALPVTDKKIRIYTASFARISVDIDGEEYYLLAFNKNRFFSGGKMVYTPIGGRLEVDKNGMSALAKWGGRRAV